jgi:hypothetical protein
VEAGPPSKISTGVLVPLRTCERVLDALRRYEERDAAVDALVAEIERVRSNLLSELYGKEANA